MDWDGYQGEDRLMDYPAIRGLAIGAAIAGVVILVATFIKFWI